MVWSFTPNQDKFAPSIIESGANPANMDAVRARLNDPGLPPYDCLVAGIDERDRHARGQGQGHALRRLRAA